MNWEAQMNSCWASRVRAARCVAMWSGTAAVCLALVSCGVPTQDVAQPLASGVIAPPALPVTPSSTPSPSPSESESNAEPVETVIIEKVNLWFAGDNGLIPVTTDVLAPVTPEAIVSGLVAGPPENEQLRTVVVDPLTGQPLISVFTGDVVSVVPDASVYISVTPEFAALPPNEQVLVLGQVVVSISGAGMGAVAFVDQSGSPVAVPLPDGRLLDGSATTSDYISLSA